MKKSVLLFFLIVAIVIGSSGCGQWAETLLSNVNGYDLTACSRSPSVCAELYVDNLDRLPTEP
jgi:hypothetical protein